MRHLGMLGEKRRERGVRRKVSRVRQERWIEAEHLRVLGHSLSARRVTARVMSARRFSANSPNTRSFAATSPSSRAVSRSR